MDGTLNFPVATPPAPGETVPIAPGVYWLRMRLPFALNHINLWLLEDGPGWTIVDCGYALDETRVRRHETVRRIRRFLESTHRDLEVVSLTIRDRRSCRSLELPVVNDRALQAFKHPFAYAASGGVDFAACLALPPPATAA